jgi:hypothetical protein
MSTAATGTARPVAPVKPDFRAGLAMLIAMSVGTGMIQAPLSTALLTAYPIVMGFLLGSRRLALQLAGSYLVLRLLHHLFLLGAQLPVVPWIGIILTMSVYGFPVLAMSLVVFTRVPMGEVMAALGKLRLPGTLLVVIMVIYRYIPTLLGEDHRLSGQAARFGGHLATLATPSAG